MNMNVQSREIQYDNVIMGAMASQITSPAIVYSTVYSDADQRKHQSSVSLTFVTGEFPAQMASDAENVSIWWRHAIWKWCLQKIGHPTRPQFGFGISLYGYESWYNMWLINEGHSADCFMVNIADCFQVILAIKLSSTAILYADSLQLRPLFDIEIFVWPIVWHINFGLTI